MQATFPKRNGSLEKTIGSFVFMHHSRSLETKIGSGPVRFHCYVSTYLSSGVREVMVFRFGVVYIPAHILR